MILGIGTDLVTTKRFANWHLYTNKQLRRVLSVGEITYCRSQPELSAQRFAVRFAAREALYKAASSAGIIQSTPLLQLCKATTITKNTHGSPFLTVKWNMLNVCTKRMQGLKIHLSVAHQACCSIAYVVIEK
jgi:phosphopantetheine--protein transferase-like protein